MDDANYQIYCWVPLMLIFMLLYTTICMFNMENRRDTLLYAKILQTGDNK